MADISTHDTVSTASHIGTRLVGALSTLGRAFLSLGETHSKMRQVEALASLSDEDLAARGIKRQDIVRVVFAGAWV